MKRPILVATIGYVLGIIGGLYFQISIVSFYIPIIAMYFIYRKKRRKKKKRKFKLICFHRYFRYILLFLNRPTLYGIILVSIISNTIVLEQNQSYQKIYDTQEKIEITGILISPREEKEYSYQYQIKIKTTKQNSQLENQVFYLSCAKTEKELPYGSYVKIEGEYQAPEKQRNYGGFDGRQYLKQKKIAGTIKAKKITIVEENKVPFYTQIFYSISKKGKQNIEEYLPKEEASLLKGMLLGDRKDIEKEIKENFQNANISHLLAISGMHITYLVLGTKFAFEKWLGKRKKGMLTILILVFYMNLIGGTPSIMRAGITSILQIVSKLIHQKNDIWNSLAFSLLLILVQNPFYVQDLGLQFSYGGTIGILLFQKPILLWWQKRKQRNKLKNRKNRYRKKVMISYRIEKIEQMISTTLAAQFMILPFMIYHFNLFSPYFLLSNLLASILIGPIMILGFSFLVCSFFSQFLSNILSTLLQPILQILLLFSKIGNLPFSKIYFPTPSIEQVIFYYFLLFFLFFIGTCYWSKKINLTQKRARNLLALLQYRARQKKRRYLKLFLLFFLFGIFLSKIPQDLKIYFVDVGQGDSTFIVTPNKKTILIDGGGSLSKDFDVGKSTLIPYLLDRGFTQIDQIYISHFDQDHCQGLFTVMKELKVKNVIIGRQFESCDNYEEFRRIVKEKKIKVHVVEAGQRIQIEKDLYFDILWPSSSSAISENSINNNSLVCKMVYKDLSVLFTGDIEAIAEKAILQKYKNTKVLQATILKVAHHGSKSSSIQEFLNTIKPKVALIGVGEKNTFGHPNSGVLERIQEKRL